VGAYIKRKSTELGYFYTTGGDHRTHRNRDTTRLNRWPSAWPDSLWAVWTAVDRSALAPSHVASLC